jgi:zinc transport system substrate-binding protein
MTRSINVLFLLTALLTVLTLACTEETVEPASDRLRVVTTTYPLTFMAERIGGNRVAVTQLVKPGVEAHDFEPAPSDIREISDASVFIYNHPALEGWALNAARTASSASGGGSVLTVQTIDLESAGEDHGGQATDDSLLDAHVWLNPLKALEQAEGIFAALSDVDPEGSEIYTANLSTLGSELRALDEQISSELASCELDSVVVSHLAYGHLAERYGFSQIGLSGLSPESESGPSQIASVIERMNDSDIRYILQEPIVSDRLAVTVAAETNAELLVLHPLETRTLEEVSAGTTYIDIMKSNSETLSTALGCS